MPQEPAIEDLFLAEATDSLHAINAGLLDLEQDPGRLQETIADVLRHAHTMKGSAAAAGLRKVQQLLHSFESCAQVLRDGRVDPDADVLAVLFAFLDAIEAVTHQVCTGTAPVAVDLPAVLAAVTATFAEHTSLPEIEVEAQPANEDVGRRGRDLALVRVATSKLDRQMANVEELVQVKADGHRRAEQTRELLDLIGDYCQLTGKLLSSTQRGAGRREALSAASLRELVQAQQVLADRALGVGQALHDGLRRHTHLLDRVGGRLQADIRSLRLLPARQAFGGFPRMTRDLALAQHKEVELVLDGGDTEMDRDLLDAVKDPVMHLLRNAIDHGIEPPKERVAAGKPACGTVTIRCESRAGGLRLTVSDDGRGLDLEAIRRRAQELDLAIPEGTGQLDGDGLRMLIFRPGFSTAKRLSEVSGRGVGLDIVRERVEALGGSLSVSSVAGAGTEFVLRLPLNLSTMRMLIVVVGGERFAIPAPTVDRVLRLGREDVSRVDRGEACEVNGQPVPVRALESVLGVGGGRRGLERRPAVIVRSASRQLALLVDSIEGEQELVVKRLPAQLEGLRKIHGAAVLADGCVVPGLNVSDILRELDSGVAPRDAFEARGTTERTRRRILIVDDSITTRTLEKSVLEAVGYLVDVATDGLDAMGKLEQGNFDLMLSDVQMPRMDGIELVTKVKAHERHRKMPVVLVSSLAGEDDRKRGLKAGADAYLDKGEFRQELLLETLERLL